MKKVNIKSKLISEEETLFSGKGILKNNELIFYENKIKNKIKILKDKIIIERISDYSLKMEFIMGKMTKGTYTMYDQNLYLDIFTSKLNTGENSVFIEYNLLINTNEKINFIYNIEYTIDS